MWLSSPTSGNTPGRTESRASKRCLHTHYSQQPKGRSSPAQASISRWTDKMWYTCTQEGAALRRKEVCSVSRESVCLVKQARPRDKHCVIPPVRGPGESDRQKDGCEQRGRGARGRIRELLNRTEFQLSKMKKPGRRRCWWLYNTQVLPGWFPWRAVSWRRWGLQSEGLFAKGSPVQREGAGLRPTSQTPRGSKHWCAEDLSGRAVWAWRAWGRVTGRRWALAIVPGSV